MHTTNIKIMKTFFKIFSLSILWFLVWAIFAFYLQPQGIDYSNNYLLTVIYFLLLIVALTSIFKKQMDGYIENFSPKDLLAMVIFSVGVSLLYYIISIVSAGSPLNAIKSGLPSILQLDERFFIAKAFDIMFQQAFFMISIYYLFDNNVKKSTDMLLFGLYVMIIHFPILFMDSPMGKIFFMSSFFAGLIFSYCITKSKKGFIYSYMVHFGFYVILAAVFWLGGAKYIAGLI